MKEGQIKREKWEKRDTPESAVGIKALKDSRMILSWQTHLIYKNLIMKRYKVRGLYWIKVVAEWRTSVNE